MASMTCALIWVVERSSADVSAERGGGVGDGEGEGEAEAEGKCFEIPDVSTSMMVESSASGEGVRTGGVKTDILLNK